MQDEPQGTDISLDDLLGPILDAMEQYGLTRMVAFPGTVTGDGLGGIGSLDLEWSEEIHEELLSVLEEPVLLDNGALLEAVAGHIVLRLEPDVGSTLADFVESGMLSQLASSFLSASLVLGKNILLTGPNQATIPLCTALLSDGERPALMGLDGMLAPAHWPILADLGEVHVLGPDRLGMWCCPTETVVEIMSASTSVIGCVPGGTQDKAIRRIRNAMLSVGMPAEQSSILSAVDVVISLGWSEGFRIQEIAEIRNSASGFESRVLFRAEGHGAEHALVPAYRPSYLCGFLNLGLDAFVSELRSASEEPMEDALAESSAPLVEYAPIPEYIEDESDAYALAEPEVSAAPQVDVDLSRTMPHRPTYSPDSIDGDAEPPGWELDQLPNQPIVETAAAGNSEDSLMAAAYGLAPPPRPAGVSAESNPNFQKALQEAKFRDEVFRRQQETTGSED